MATDVISSEAQQRVRVLNYVCGEKREQEFMKKLISVRLTEYKYFMVVKSQNKDLRIKNNSPCHKIQVANQPSGGRMVAWVACLHLVSASKSRRNVLPSNQQ